MKKTPAKRTAKARAERPSRAVQPSSDGEARVETRELAPSQWKALAKLFGENGACGGCWCQSWRIEKGESYDDVKGPEAKRRMRALVEGGRAHGVLAFVEGEPVGWCAFDRRRDFARLDRAPSFACDDADDVWSLPCFYVKSGHRSRGVATALLAHAVRAIAERGGTIAEGYPVKPPADGKPIPAAFAWTGTRPLFEKAGFSIAGNPEGGKQRVRKRLMAGRR